MGYDYGKHFGEVKLTHDLMTLPHERTWRLAPPERDAAPHEIVLYLGCNVLRTVHMIQTVTAVFDRLGLDYVTVGGPTYCCGIVHHRQGDVAAGRAWHAHGGAVPSLRPREFVMWCRRASTSPTSEAYDAAVPRPAHDGVPWTLPKLAFTQSSPARCAALHCLIEPRTRGAGARVCSPPCRADRRESIRRGVDRAARLRPDKLGPVAGKPTR